MSRKWLRLESPFKMLSGALHMWPGTQHYRFAAGVACMGHPDHGRMTLKGYTGGGLHILAQEFWEFRTTAILPYLVDRECHNVIQCHWGYDIVLIPIVYTGQRQPSCYYILYATMKAKTDIEHWNALLSKATDVTKFPTDCFSLADGCLVDKAI